MRPRKILPLLSSVIGGRVAPDGNGLCFHRAAALLLDIKHGDLCIGTVRAGTPEERAARPEVSAVPFLHAWVEVAACVYSPTLIDNFGGGLMPIDRRLYYRENDVRDVHRMNRRDLKRLAEAHDWLKLPFGERLGKPGVGAVLLEALGVPHVRQGRTPLPAPGPPP